MSTLKPETCQEFISAIRVGKCRECRKEYRNLGVLIIDDIQYLRKIKQHVTSSPTYSANYMIIM